MHVGQRHGTGRIGRKDTFVDEIVKVGTSLVVELLLQATEHIPQYTHTHTQTHTHTHTLCHTHARARAHAHARAHTHAHTHTPSSDLPRAQSLDAAMLASPHATETSRVRVKRELDRSNPSVQCSASPCTMQRTNVQPPHRASELPMPAAATAWATAEGARGVYHARGVGAVGDDDPSHVNLRRADDLLQLDLRTGTCVVCLPRLLPRGSATMSARTQTPPFAAIRQAPLSVSAKSRQHRPSLNANGRASVRRRRRRTVL